jgi:hypothetical protein
MDLDNLTSACKSTTKNKKDKKEENNFSILFTFPFILFYIIIKNNNCYGY